MVEWRRLAGTFGRPSRLSREKERRMDREPKPDHHPIHGHTGPTTPAEEWAREADPDVVSPDEKARIAEEASRAEDA
jgi:hypothetical protein